MNVRTFGDRSAATNFGTGIPSNCDRAPVARVHGPSLSDGTNPRGKASILLGERAKKREDRNTTGTRLFLLELLERSIELPEL